MIHKNFNIISYALKIFARLPMPVIHFMGIILGWVVYACSKKSAHRMRENLWQSGICPDEASFRQILHRNIGESGKALLETFAIWFRDDQQQLSLVEACDGWENVEAALSRGKGIIFLTPHLGCFEITSLYYAAHHPISILYRPPRQSWMAPMIVAGRTRGQLTLAPTNTKGVRELLQALRKGQAVGILPDQKPGAGEGEWAPYFGRPAYTMTLVSRLAQKTGASVMLAFGERLPYGKGYHIHFDTVPEGAVNTTAGLNATIEAQVRRYPEQYMWNYHRYKVSRGTRPMVVE